MAYALSKDEDICNLGILAALDEEHGACQMLCAWKLHIFEDFSPRLQGALVYHDMKTYNTFFLGKIQMQHCAIWTFSW